MSDCRTDRVDAVDATAACQQNIAGKGKLSLRLRRVLEGKLRLGAFAVIGALHLLMISLLLRSASWEAEPPDNREIQLKIVNTPEEELSLPVHLDPAKIALIPTPDIQIAKPAPPADTITAVPYGQILPPRPDPARHNSGPALPPALAQQIRANVVLRVLVLPDGSVSDATVAQSSGRPEGDLLAVEFAISHWHFLPAMLGKTATQYWTTAIMRFTAA